jgi:hypothetical protein
MELDFTSDELSVIPSDETAGLDPVDHVAVHGDFIVGSAGGVPRWSSGDRSGDFEPLPPLAELEGVPGVSYAASEQTAPGAPGRASEWLLVHEGGLPRVALSLPDAALVRIAPDAAAELAPADRIQVRGAWAFGFVRTPVETSGSVWFEPYRAAWRVHLPSGRVTGIPDVPGYTTLEDSRYVVVPGTKLVALDSARLRALAQG